MSDKICPIVSAFSELKQFSDYPKCRKECGWWDSYSSGCAIAALPQAIRDAVMAAQNQQVELDWQTKEDLKAGGRGLADLLGKLVERSP